MPLPRLSNRPPRAGFYAPIGAMNRLVTFYSPGARDAQGRAGAPSPAFPAVWAAVYAVAGEELDKAQQIAQKVSVVLVINYQLGVLENMTVEVPEAGATRTLQVAAIADPDGQKWQLKIYCFEINSNAGGAN
jgi:SPP1 family predicted phage head-tail adaptor